jgi:hypothetical protein
MLIAVFTTMVYLRISTGDEYLDRASVMCVAQKGLCEDRKAFGHTYMVDSFGNSICVERSTPCVTSSLISVENVTLSDAYLTDHVLDVKRQDVFPHSTAIIVLSFIGFCISFLFDHAPTAVVARNSTNYSDAMRQWFLQKVGILVNLTNFAVILASAYTYKEMFSETCNSLRNPQFCADLDAQNLVIWSVLNAQNELMDNYQLCWMIIGVALLFGVMMGSQRKLLFSFSRVVAPSSPRRQLDSPEFNYRTHTPVGTSSTYTSAASNRAMAISDAAHRFIVDAAKPGVVYFLSPNKCCSICLVRLALDFEISENEMDLLVQAAQRKLGEPANIHEGECYANEIDGRNWQEVDEEGEIAPPEKREKKPDRKQSVSEIELCVAEFAPHRKKSISDATSGENEVAAAAPVAVAGSAENSPRSADADSRLMDVASCVVELPCHHVFHLRCIRAWVDAKLWNVNCPECRAPIVSVDAPASDDLIV